MLRANHELSMAVTRALIVLGYFELPDDETPDESIWGHPEKLEAWFDEVKSKRNNPGSERVSNAEWEQAELEQNELTKGLR